LGWVAMVNLSEEEKYLSDVQHDILVNLFGLVMATILTTGAV
jgi:hypothetical protein